MNNDQEMREILLSANTVASVGLSSNDEKESYWIVFFLKEQGYRMIPVNPTATEIFGEKAYASLSDIPDKIDVVQVFRRPEDVPPVVDEAIKIGAKVVWMQEGIITPVPAVPLLWMLRFREELPHIPTIGIMVLLPVKIIPCHLQQALFTIYL